MELRGGGMYHDRAIPGHIYKCPSRELCASDYDLLILE